jgi:hypothetical protein
VGDCCYRHVGRMWYRDSVGMRYCMSYCDCVVISYL